MPELPDLLTEEETQVLEGHHDQADGALDAFNTLMTRGLAKGQQHEINLRDLLTDIRCEQKNKHYYGCIIASVTLTLTIFLSYLASKCWR
jgi:hypothetical protein